MAAVVSATLGRLLAWITEAPGAIAVTGTGTVVAPARNVTVAGTVAALVLLDERFTVVPPAGAGADKVRVRFCVPGPVKVRPGGENTMVAITWSVEFAGT